NGTLFFVADDGQGFDLWKSDGTAAGTVPVHAISLASVSGFRPYADPLLTNVNGTLFFVAEDGSNDYALWKSDGTSAGTVVVADLSGETGDLTNVNGTLF